ncbi:MAG TPA: chromate efflux transporter, partial [Verrucomicrobiae bacterium]|nr:chromate efflux transporter [Verrucomicrobiae bacterium]
MGQIALMHRVFVDERHWIDDARFQRMLAFCMLLPGPEAQQLATYVGWRLRGWAGALIAGWLFVLPGAFVVLGLSALYVVYGTQPLVAAAFDGVKCAVVALVAEALYKVGKRALKTSLALWIAIAAFVALLFNAPFPLVIVAAGLVGVALSPLLTKPAGAGPSTDAIAATQKREGALGHAALWFVLWLTPPALVALTLGTEHVLFQVALLFSILACVTFGGAYALLAYLTAEAVARGWLTTAQMIDGLGLAETTPGPLILVNEFVGFMAGWSAAGWGLAIAGAAIALWCTFVPSFVWIFAGAPVAERLENNRRAAGALAAITAAVLGVIAKLALFFAAHALFAR